VYSAKNQGHDALCLVMMYENSYSDTRVLSRWGWRA